MKSIDLTYDSYAEYNEDSNKKIQNLMLVTMSEFQNIKTFLLKDKLQISQKMFLLLVKLKIQTYVISDLSGEEITGSFHLKKKNLE